MALPLFHAITGCDTISHFLGCGKKTAGASWQNTPGLTETLLALTNAPSCFSLGSLHMQKLERVVVITLLCGLAKVNETRHRLFTGGQKTLENIPPSRAALFEHTKSADSGQFLLESSNLCSPRNPGFPRMGVAKGKQWYLVAFNNIPKCHLLHSNCERSCTGNCKCS